MHDQRITKRELTHLSAWDFHLATINGEFDPSLVPDAWDQLPAPVEPAAVELDAPTGVEIDAATGPTLANVCYDVSGNGDVQCWDVIPTPYTPFPGRAG